MSTAPSPNRTERSLELMADEDSGTVTLVEDRDPAGTVPPTAWLTVPAELVVDTEAKR
ncbi:hypothetical protein GRX03_04145 [Halovenus sp. WSH3]|uniref:Uncharacterized protein n=1 Tax=Halovenus carboxidivorans TaxID=2692199 RepID=A0A6B0T0Q8_9EURY|nr:hypothetical protein [Halovenus carboxidivorans]MXR50797.1 hypothetical protein [Halovenus carboxidivorans]